MLFYKLLYELINATYISPLRCDISLKIISSFSGQSIFVYRAW